MNHGEDTATDGGELIPAEPGPEEERSIRSQDDLQELVELERRRIDRDNRRTQLQEKALELANDQDKRGFNTHQNNNRWQIGVRSVASDLLGPSR